MANQLSNELLAQLLGQRSDDPFLALLTLSHDSFSTIRLVNNTINVTSNGNVFYAFPFRLILPTDDSETLREMSIDFDNVGLDLLDEIRSVTTPISLKLDFILASIPDEIQMSFEELKIQSITYNRQRISAKIFLDTFLNTEMTSEKYLPTNFPGIF